MSVAWGGCSAHFTLGKAVLEFLLRFPLERIRDVMTRAAREVRAAWDRCVEWGGEQVDRVRERLDSKPAPAGPRVVNFEGPAAVTPEGRRIYAIGDVHGRADLLKRLLDDIQADALGGAYRGKPILILLGDYIDRGFQSKDVIDILLGKQMSSFETYFLKGNHEAALLQFLSDPSIGPRWMEFGGAETLVSYGVRPPRTRTAMEEWAIASDALKRAMPREHLEFLKSLQLSVLLGDYMFVHAGVRPGVELDRQSESDLLWIREDFLNDARPLGVVVVHGHTPASKPHRDSRRVGLDTGAYLSGKLTAARFEHDTVEFLSTGAGSDTVRPMNTPQEARG